MRIVLGADHGGFDLKEVVKESLVKRGIEVEDLGCHDKTSVDYPEYARDVALKVSRNAADEGILICTTGIGMAIAANKFPRIRAALCCSARMAAAARVHNNANILVLGGGIVAIEEAESILDAWLGNEFEPVERYERRIGKAAAYARRSIELQTIQEEDPEAYAAIRGEVEREQKTINLIASENYASDAVREAQGSVMTNKYAEGYPGKRWYNGCANIDAVESLAIKRARELFGAEHVNVQPHCGSSANMAVYFAELQPGDTILTMSLKQGGHLTHGNHVNFSGRFFNVVHYGVSRESERIDYDEVEKLAREHSPRLVVAGASAYPRILDFSRFREIAHSVGALLMVDMAHLAGLVAGGAHPDPVPEADFVTSTTHKTLRGPRGGMIISRKKYAENIDKQVFPGVQGGPLMHIIAAKAVCFQEALRPSFSQYARQIVANAKALAAALKDDGMRLISGGTDNHLMLLDLSPLNITGKDAAAALEQAGIVANKNAIPFDTKSPFLTSGIRLGTPAVTTRGMKEPEMRLIGALVLDVIRNPDDSAVINRVRGKVEELTRAFPVP